MSDPQTLGMVANQIQSSMQSMMTLISGMSYIAGLMFGVKAAFKFKQHAENPERVALSEPFAMMFMAFMMLGLLPFLSTSTSVLFPPIDAKTKAVESAGASGREIVAINDKVAKHIEDGAEQLKGMPSAVDPAAEARKAVEAANAKVVVEQAMKAPEPSVAAAKLPDPVVEVAKPADVKIIREPAKGSSADTGAFAYVLIGFGLLGLVGFGVAKRAARKKSEENELASLSIDLERAKDGIAPTRVPR